MLITSSSTTVYPEEKDADNGLSHAELLECDTVTAMFWVMNGRQRDCFMKKIGVKVNHNDDDTDTTAGNMVDANANIDMRMNGTRISISPDIVTSFRELSWDFHSIIPRWSFCAWLNNNPQVSNILAVMCIIVSAIGGVPPVSNNACYQFVCTAFCTIGVVPIVGARCDKRLLFEVMTSFNFCYVYFQAVAAYVVSCFYVSQLSSTDKVFFIGTNICYCLCTAGAILACDTTPKLNTKVKAFCWFMLFAYYTYKRVDAVQFMDYDEHTSNLICVGYYDCASPRSILIALYGSLVLFSLKYFVYSILRPTTVILKQCPVKIRVSELSKSTRIYVVGNADLG